MNREQKKQITRDKILTSAERLFKEKGYQQVSTRQIAKEAEVGVGTVFSHFADKSELTRVLFHQKIAEELGELHQRVHALEGLTYFYAYAAGLYEFYDHDRAFSIALLQNSLTDGDYFSAQVDQFVHMIAERLTNTLGSKSEAEKVVFAKSLFGFYLQQLVIGLSIPEQSPEDWLAKLKIDCQTLLALTKP